MSRHPDWFERLDTIFDLVRESSTIPWFGRKEIQGAFGCSERDSIRLLHKLGAEVQDDALRLSRGSLLAQLEAIRNGNRYAAFLRQRNQVARQLSLARQETAARQFRIRPVEPEEPPKRLDQLPPSVTWRRTNHQEPGRFEILYDDGADLMRQIALFLEAASADREAFFAATELADDGRR